MIVFINKAIFFSSSLTLSKIFILLVFLPYSCSHNCSHYGTCHKAGEFWTDFACQCCPAYYEQMCEYMYTACELAKREEHFYLNGGVCRDI